MNRAETMTLNIPGQAWLKKQRIHWVQIAAHLGAAIPLAALIWAATTGGLTINPIQDITFRTGKAAIWLLVLSLAVTPAQMVSGYRPLVKTRRPLGLWAFFYAGLHFLIFVGLDYGFNWGLLQEAIFEKRYALVGFAAFVIMLPLAITSTKGWMVRLGKRWKGLHRWVYVAGILAAIHYIWVVKADLREPLAFTAAIGILLLMRVPVVRKRIVRWRQQFGG
jgi:sulfoxide reductase heme-binding subunit YedZ